MNARSAVLLTGFAVASTFVFTPPTHIASWGAQALAASASVGGRRLSCGTGKVIINNKMSAIGRASPSKREIYLNLRRLRGYNRTFQQFVFLHECAHMYIVDESRADCWAIRRGLYRGLFSARSVDSICKALWNTPSGRYHFGGPNRCQHMKTCLATTKSNIKRRKVRRRKVRRRKK